MKIIAKEEAIRYHVEFDEEETALFKSVGFLPPHAEPRARLWLTEADMDKTLAMLTQAKKKRREASR
jgi:hypothetical protein